MNKQQLKWNTPSVVFNIFIYTSEENIPYFSLEIRGLKNYSGEYKDPFLAYINELVMFGFLKNSSINSFKNDLYKNINMYLEEVINSEEPEVTNYKNHRIMDTIRRSLNSSMLDIENMHLLTILEACGIMKRFEGDYYVIEPKHLTREQVNYVNERIIK